MTEQRFDLTAKDRPDYWCLQWPGRAFCPRYWPPPGARCGRARRAERLARLVNGSCRIRVTKALAVGPSDADRCRVASMPRFLEAEAQFGT